MKALPEKYLKWIDKCDYLAFWVIGVLSWGIVTYILYGFNSQVRAIVGSSIVGLAGVFYIPLLVYGGIVQIHRDVFGD